jgi:putative transposase
MRPESRSEQEPQGAFRPRRGHPAHITPVERHNTPVIILVTVCTWERYRILDNDAAHGALVRAWGECREWVVGNYTVMPDHVHVFCAPAGRGVCAVQEWATYWKRLAGSHDAAIAGEFQWDCWDTQMRSVGHYCRKLEYVANNPVRVGLVAHPQDWPFQGRLQPLRW